MTSGTHIRPWRRELASGHRPVQEKWVELVAAARTIHTWESGLISGMLQTPDYARHVFMHLAELQNSPKDTGDAVRARMRRQEWLDQPGNTLHLLMWEGALRARICPPAIMAAQLDHLAEAVDTESVRLGIVPFDAALKVPPGDGFWIFDDDRLVITEDWHAELWLDDADTIATYRRVWQTLYEAAVFGADARQVIQSARGSLGTRDRH
ncbi:DUF5753 domain-containing protein [Streptomyces sp. TRM64462]|uniref:DUF5753 domain-containing protein n=1 Tax=Streptomyces sp. TRM64462 TaxID=2741726 RepID=UPI0015869241|nr:DUF5753 domain-containing protein [Streptomyces sp. TRM64462]